MPENLTYTNDAGKTFKVKETNGKFFFWSPRAARWLPVAKDKVRHGPIDAKLTETANVLHRAGHTEAKATEIARKAERGDPDALAWVSNIRTAVEDGTWPLTRRSLQLTPRRP